MHPTVPHTNNSISDEKSMRAYGVFIHSSLFLVKDAVI